MARKPKYIQGFYDCDLFKRDVFLVIGDWTCLAEWGKTIVEKDLVQPFLDSIDHGDRPPPEGYYVEIKNGGGVIWLAPSSDLSIMTHEIVHAAMAILDSSGVPISRENDEVMAYLVGRMYETFSPVFIKAHKKPSPRRRKRKPSPAKPLI